MKKILKKRTIAGIIVLLVFLFVFFGFFFPLTFCSHKTRYLAESDLKEAVNIQDLSTIEYVYHGIAEKPGKFLWADTVDYRVRYEAHVQAFYDMSEIEFTIDYGSHTVTTYLPRPQIGSPVLDETKFGYLPDRATANMRDVLALCREDAANEFNTDAIQSEASESLKNTVEALTSPLLGSEWALEFANLSDLTQEEVENDAA